MGIKGLLQFLKEQQRIEHLRTFRGCTAAVDVYCWLHKAVYGCVEQIAIAGNDQGQYIAYCEKYWNLLKSAGIKPILVFDGQNLPAKAHTERERRERRKANRDKANALLAEGKKSEARQYFERCIDITPQMAHKVIVAAVSQGVDCIVAPYEADAQLAYLSLTGIAQLIISEDSDLLCFGCERVMFKLDLNGNGVVQERSTLLEHRSFHKKFTFEHFVKMCILSGCDYLPSLPGIGLAKSCKFMSQQQFSADTAGMLRRLPLSVKVPRGSVTEEYIQQFTNAVMTFRHQVVFDPVSRQRKPMTSQTDTCCGLSEHPQDMTFAGRYFPAKQAFQMALGNINLHTMDTLLPEIDPDLLLSRENGKLSVWHPEYKPKGQWNRDDPRAIDRQTHSTKNQSVLVPADRVVRKRKLSQSESQDVVDAITNDDTTTDVTAEATQNKTESFSTINVTAKPTEICRKESTSPLQEETSGDKDFDSLLEGPSTPPKLTPSQKSNRFIKDKLRGLYHKDGEEHDSPNITVTSRYFGSSQQPTEVNNSKDSGIAADESASPTKSPSASQSDPLTQFSPSHSSTQRKPESPAKYKAKFLGALDELDSNPSPQIKAFRWSKSSLHESVAAGAADLSPSLTQQFKSPLFKSRLTQVTSSAARSYDTQNEEGAGEAPLAPSNVNPFKQCSTIKPVMRSDLPANPFKVSSSSDKKKPIFGKAVLDKQTAHQSDPFSAKQLTRIGSKSERSPVTQRLSAFISNKQSSPVNGDKTENKPATKQSSQKENLLASVSNAKPHTPLRTPAKVLEPLSTWSANVDSVETEVADAESSECTDGEEKESSESDLTEDPKSAPVDERVAVSSPLTDASAKENCDSIKKSTAISAFLSKFTRTKSEKMAARKSRLGGDLLVNTGVVIDLT